MLKRKIKSQGQPKPKKNKKVAKQEIELDGEVQELQDRLNISAATVEKGTEGLITFTQQNPKLQGTLFEGESIPLFLQVNCIKIPKMHSRIFRIPLRHSIVSPDADICLIVPDVKGYKNKEHDKHIEHYENILQNKGVTNIKKIMTFHEFRTEYETFELRSRLVELYDVFLVDGRISGKVVRKCGKIFYKKRKVPTSIKLQATKLKDHIEQTLKKTPLFLHSKGDSFVVQFGHSNLDLPKLVENAFSIFKGLDKEFPGGFSNIRSINLTSHRGLALPVYLTLKNQNEVAVHEEEVKTGKDFEPVRGELSTKLNSDVVVDPSGRVVVKKKRKFTEDEPENEEKAEDEEEALDEEEDEEAIDEDSEDEN